MGRAGYDMTIDANGVVAKHKAELEAKEVCNPIPASAILSDILQTAQRVAEENFKQLTAALRNERKLASQRARHNEKREKKLQALHDEGQARLEKIKEEIQAIKVR
jgi:crotonobetainyl-CoA:carnitine CoA-transferase CaiB-like acyl-CoA transferase